MHTMEAWMYRAERTSFGPSDEIYPPFGDPTVAKLAPVEWSMGNFCGYDNIISATTVGATENPSSIESGFPGIQETFFGNSIEELLESKIKEHAVTSPLPPFVKSAIREQEESSKDSSSVVDSNGQDSSLVDLKLGRLCDHRVSEDSKSLNDIGSDSSQASPAPVKRLRSTSLNGLTPFCQVHGCNMDLSNFKDYYKRHRVCQAHSKTAKVVVNSLQQRFCQQCSRFHLLSEFDDGKRSCRKRLAGHNARRRKPQISVHAGSTGMILQPYHGNHILGNAVSGRESFSQDMFTSSFSYEVNGESTNWCKHPNLDYASGGIHISKSTFNGQPHAKFITASHGMRKEFPFLNGDSMVGSIYNEYGSVAEVGLAASGSCFNIGSCVNGSPRVSGFSCARSLLSSQPQGLSISSSCPISQPSISHVGNDQNNSSRCTTRVVPVGSQTSTNVVCSLGMNEVGDDHLGLLASNVNNAVDLEVHTHKSLEEYQIANSKDMLSYNHGHTVNLLELSSLLHNAELRRRPLQVKEEFEPFIPIS